MTLVFQIVAIVALFAFIDYARHFKNAMERKAAALERIANALEAKQGIAPEEEADKKS